MNTAAHNKLVSFIWSIADDCLRDVYVRGKYRDVILPMVVLRRLDALLETTKDTVMEELAFQRDEVGLTEWDGHSLQQASGYVFYNTSVWTLQRLHDTATNSKCSINSVLQVGCVVCGGFCFCNAVVQYVEYFAVYHSMCCFC